MGEMAGGRLGARLALSLSRLFLSASCLALLAACEGERPTISFQAEPALMPRLQSILAASPTPESWKLASEGAKASCVVILTAPRPGEAPPKNAALCGTECFAASVDIGDPRYSVSAGRAEEMGLEPLESILPPRRALAVEGTWPPESKYPFSRPLYLSAAAPDSRPIPAEVGRWLKKAAAAALARDTLPSRLAAVGDIQVGEGQASALLGGEEGFRNLMDEGVLSDIRLADFAVANLEGPVSARGDENPRKKFHFRMPPGTGSALKAIGFDLVLFGNNHAFDYGPEAFADTLEDLEKASLPEVGAGKDLVDASKPRFIRLPRGERLAFVGLAFFPDEITGFTLSEAAAGEGKPGIDADLESAIASVREAAASGATVVVLAHGGIEYQQRPSEGARKLYARLVDAGAALVLGSHPHLLQGCEARSGSIIAYSLGNFLFTLEDEPPEAWKGAVLDFLVYRGKVRGILPLPIIAGYSATQMDPDSEAARARFARLCSSLGDAPKLNP